MRYIASFRLSSGKMKIKGAVEVTALLLISTC